MQVERLQATVETQRTAQYHVTNLPSGRGQPRETGANPR
jgi:hypothetical protein